MAESKRTFQSAKMDKDIDDRLLPAGTYRDALNVSVEFSEDGNVGALENLKGNEAVVDTFPSYLDSTVNIGVKVIGSYADTENKKLYYFFSGSTTDGIVEYDEAAGTIKPIILDGLINGEVDSTSELPTFTFADAVASASVSDGGVISAQARLGTITVLTPNFNTPVTTPAERSISVQVKVPDGYTNSGGLVEGILTVTQPAVGDPEVFLKDVSNLTDTSATFNAYYTSDTNITAIGFKYVENAGGSDSQTLYENYYFASSEDFYGNAVTVYNPTTGEVPFKDVPSSDFILLDSNNATISSSDYTIETFESGRPPNVSFADTFNLQNEDHIIVAQPSTADAITNGRDYSYLTTSANATTVSVTPVTGSFKADITGLSPSTNYLLVAYATNTEGTVYTNMLSFKTKAASITLPTFSSTTATAGTSLVVFGGTPVSNGGDTNARLYVVSDEAGTGTIADYKTAAYNLMGGGTSSQYELHTIGSWVANTPQTVSVATTGGQANKGLIFAKNSSPLQNGSDNAGYTFDTAFVSATANTPNVAPGSSFSGTQAGPTGTKTAGGTLTWSISGTSTVTQVPSSNYGYLMTANAVGDSAWAPGVNWANPSPTSPSTLNATATWSASTTTTAPTAPGTYSWTMTMFYGGASQTNGLATGSFTIPSPPATSGTFSLEGNFIIGPNVGQTYGGSTGTGLLFSGAVPSAISVGSQVTITGGGATNVIQVSSITSGSSSFIGYTLYSGTGGVFYGSGTSVNWSV